METILIIEDDELIRENLIELFTNEGYLTLAAENGKIGLELAIKRIPDMILSDIMMPEMDGFQVYRSIRSEPLLSVIPFIFLSALSDKLNIRSGMELGADDYITKPFLNSELIHAVKNRIEKSRASKKAMEDLKLNLIRSVPHEFLTPLNSILGFSQLLIDGCHEKGGIPIEDVLEFSGYIHSAGNKLLRITHNYVLFTELTTAHNSRKLQSRLEEDVYFDVEKTLPDFIMEIAKRESCEGNLEIQFEKANLSISVKSLNKILEELVDNALKFSGMQSLVTIKGFRENNFYRIIIEDKGKGMSFQEIQRVEAFTQFNRSKMEQSGLGLGLSLVQMLLDLNQGEFWIESEKGKGTRANIRVGLLDSK